MRKSWVLWISFCLLPVGAVHGADDHLFTVTELELSFTEADLLANDVWTKGFAVQTLPTSGDLTEQGGVYRYWSDPGFAGWDSFTYSTSRSSGETVWIYVSPLVRPILGDFFGDDQDEIGYFNAYEARFYLCPGPNGSHSPQTCSRYGFGASEAGWMPLVGDWNGDGKDQLGLYDPDEAIVRLLDLGSCSTPCVVTPLHPNMTFSPVGGTSSRSLPVAGDWDGDGVDTVGFFDPDLGRFTLPDQHPVPTQVEVVDFGDASSIPYALPCWDGGYDTVGVFDPATLMLTALDAAEKSVDVAFYPDVAAGWGISTYAWAPQWAPDLAWYDPADHTILIHPPGGQAFLYCFTDPSGIDDGTAGSQIATVTPPPVEPPPR